MSGEYVYEASYTTKDLILYALSLGMGSQANDDDNDNENDKESSDSRFLYERHANFTAVPTFCFAFTFWAQRARSRARSRSRLGIGDRAMGSAGTTGSSSTNSSSTTTTSSSSTTTQSIPPFPPPIMADEQVIPPRFLRNNDNHNNHKKNTTDLSAMPVIHTWQSIVWHRPLEVPRGDSVSTIRIIRNETIRVQPKSIGTFVTSQSQVVKATATATNTTTTTPTSMPLCTIQSTALVLGMDPTKVIAHDAGVAKLTMAGRIPNPNPSSARAKTQQQQQQQQQEQQQQQQQQQTPPLWEWNYQTSRSQALLYRIASGDSNRIHVDTSASDMLGTETRAPLLHGLFTLALAVRGILEWFDDDHQRKRKKKNAGVDFDDVGVDVDDVEHNDAELAFQRLEGAFKAPGFVGDSLCVKIWESSDGKSDGNSNSNSNSDANETPRPGNATTKRFFFVITNAVTGAKLVDHGYAQVEITSRIMSSATKSRL